MLARSSLFAATILIAACGTDPMEEASNGEATLSVTVGEQSYSLESQVEATLLAESVYLHVENEQLAVWLNMPRATASVGEQQIGIVASESASLSVHVKTESPRALTQGVLRVSSVDLAAGGTVQLAIEDAEKPSDAFGARITVDGTIEGTLRAQ